MAWAIAALARANGLVLVLAVALHNVLVSRKALGQRDHRATSWQMELRGGPFVAILSIYFAWRFLYYGFPFPNTFYAKVATEISQWVRGYVFLVDALRFYLGGSLIPAALLIIGRLYRMRNLPMSLGITLLVGHSLCTRTVGEVTLSFYGFYTAHCALVVSAPGVRPLVRHRLAAK